MSIESRVAGLAAAVQSRDEEIHGVDVSAPGSSSERSDVIECGENRGFPLIFPLIGTGQGSGAYYRGTNGRSYLDLLGGVGAQLFGHGYPRIREAAIRGAMADVVMQGPMQPGREYAELTRALCEFTMGFSPLRHAWITTCGTMANETALKIALQRNPSSVILTFEGCYGGHSVALSRFREPAENAALALRSLAFPAHGDRSAIERCLSQFRRVKDELEHAVFFFEPFQMADHFSLADRDALIEILDHCRAQGWPVIADEVLSFLRIPELMAIRGLGIADRVDICTVGKALQCGAVFFTEAMHPVAGTLTGTFASSSSSLSAARETLALVQDPHWKGRVTELGRCFAAGLESLVEGSCLGLMRDVRAQGLFVAFQSAEPDPKSAERLLRAFFRRGLIAYYTRGEPTRILLTLPAVMRDEDIAAAVSIIESALIESRDG